MMFSQQPGGIEGGRMMRDTWEPSLFDYPDTVSGWCDSFTAIMNKKNVYDINLERLNIDKGQPIGYPLKINRRIFS